MNPLPSVTAADALDDGDWFSANPRRRYRVRPAPGGAWIVRRRGRAMLRTFAAVLPPGLPDADEALRPMWFAAAWADLDPPTRADLVKEARKAESSAATKRTPMPTGRASGESP